MGTEQRSPWEVDDGLWKRIAPLLPVVERRTRYPGRKRPDDRRVLNGILFVLYTGTLGGSCRKSWDTAREARAGAGCGTGMRPGCGTLHDVLPSELRAADMLTSPRARGGGLAPAGDEGRRKTGPSPVDRGRRGCKHHVIVEARGIPLAVTLTGGNRHDVTQLMPLVNAVPAVGGSVSVPADPEVLYADHGYDYDTYRRHLRGLGIRTVIARRGTEHCPGLGVHRWVVEAAFALRHWFRRLRTRGEIRDDPHEAFLTLSCSITYWRRLKSSFC